jgi:hypothetical protein
MKAVKKIIKTDPSWDNLFSVFYCEFPLLKAVP